MNFPEITKNNNMGLVRYYLAFSVLISHFNTLFGTDFFWPTNTYNAVGGFFALSGFLVYGSYVKAGDLKKYLSRRARRILPPYFFIVLLCAFGLVFVSSLPAAEYFGSGQWWKYLISNLVFLNFLEPCLPGVFTDNIEPVVNGSLWTMKVEWLLYLSVPIVAWIILKCRKRLTLVIVVIYVCSLIYRLIMTHLYVATENEIYNILGRQFLGQLMFFYIGVLVRFKLDLFYKYKWSIFIGSLLLTGISFFMPYWQSIIFISPISVSLLTIWFSMIGKWGVWAGSKDNVSYDMYLYHFPVIQVFYWWGISQFAGIFPTFIICLAVIVLLSLISWHGVGKKFVLKKNNKCGNLPK